MTKEPRIDRPAGQHPSASAFDIDGTTPAGAEPGDWTLLFTVRDQVGNVRSFSPQELQARGLPYKVTVTN